MFTSIPIWIWLVLGALGGTTSLLGGQWLINRGDAKDAALSAEVKTTIEDGMKSLADATEELSSLDLVEPLCARDRLDEEGLGAIVRQQRVSVCLYALCSAHSQSITTDKGGGECEKFSNQIQSLTILDICGGLEGQARVNCEAVFSTRK